MYYLLFSQGNNGYANAPQCYVIGTLPVLFIFKVIDRIFVRISERDYSKEAERVLWRQDVCSVETGRVFCGDRTCYEQSLFELKWEAIGLY
jgi:hypothetical protein